MVGRLGLGLGLVSGSDLWLDSAEVGWSRPVGKISWVSGWLGGWSMGWTDIWDSVSEFGSVGRVLVCGFGGSSGLGVVIGTGSVLNMGAGAGWMAVGFAWVGSALFLAGIGLVWLGDRLTWVGIWVGFGRVGLDWVWATLGLAGTDLDWISAFFRAEVSASAFLRAAVCNSAFLRTASASVFF